MNFADIICTGRELQRNGNCLVAQEDCLAGGDCWLFLFRSVTLWLLLRRGRVLRPSAPFHCGEESQHDCDDRCSECGMNFHFMDYSIIERAREGGTIPAQDSVTYE